MLSAGTTRTVGIDTKIIIVDFNIKIFLDLWHNITGNKRSLTLSCCVKWGNTNQSVNTLLRL